MNYCSFYLASGHGCLECSQYIKFLQSFQKCVSNFLTTWSNGSWMLTQLDRNGCITIAKPQHLPPSLSFLGLLGCPRPWPSARTHWPLVHHGQRAFWLVLGTLYWCEIFYMWPQGVISQSSLEKQAEAGPGPGEPCGTVMHGILHIIKLKKQS